MPRDLQPILNNDGRWHHIASAQEIVRAMRDKSAEIIEVPAIGMTYVISRATLTIIRAGALGGDTVNIEGGWRYSNDMDFILDREELRDLEKNTHGASV